MAEIMDATELLPELFAENIIAKALRTAKDALKVLPDAFPEYVPQDAGSDGSYHLREADFWTCGFFPGTLYAILERLVKFPQSVDLAGSNGLSENTNITHLRDQFTTMCRTWAEPLHGMAGRTDTHDIGFIVMPALRADWELTGNTRSLDSIIRAAASLATRYVPSAKAIRSWDLLKKKDIEILDQNDNMIVIIDSLCNLDLLYYASKHSPDGAHLAEMATAHATTLLQSHLRPEFVEHKPVGSYNGKWYSTCHVANLDPKSGLLKRRLTAQGYAHESTWARGQAWGILGYAQTYMWTRDTQFLHASCGLAEYFLYRLDTAPACVDVGRYVPLWDFDAPIEDFEKPLRDSSAGVIAANGMLVLAQALESIDQAQLAKRFRKAASAIIQDTLAFALAPEKAKLVTGLYQHIRAEDVEPGVKFEGMLKFGTANNNENARKRYANHGLVYGDYYLVEFGNRLLRMGFV
ncbi:Six-hairpin glycosidase [Corynespora cassiicola Philippines]|uniref:Six-hairpin glycosidase n=1 Tax=Corynespora cassiicola Philippines TaxID=1448308 RepID=A0A2T2NJQ1_CORCC|nr:Six-hairpin glycosidase [Corynespora cassiicola Philippines]